MKELVEYIIKQIVANPDDVVVEEQVDGSNVTLTLTVHPEDMGIVIGKKGQTIKSVRKILSIRAMAEDVRVFLQLNDVEGGRKEVEAPEEA